MNKKNPISDIGNSLSGRVSSLQLWGIAPFFFLGGVLGGGVGLGFRAGVLLCSRRTCDYIKERKKESLIPNPYRK